MQTFDFGHRIQSAISRPIDYGGGWLGVIIYGRRGALSLSSFCQVLSYDQSNTCASRRWRKRSPRLDVTFSSLSAQSQCRHDPPIQLHEPDRGQPMTDAPPNHFCHTPQKAASCQRSKARAKQAQSCSETRIMCNYLARQCEMELNLTPTPDDLTAHKAAKSPAQKPSTAFDIQDHCNPHTVCEQAAHDGCTE